MLRLAITLSALTGLAVVTSGCVAHGHARVEARATTPELVYVGPGVYVIEDYHEPVFYSGGAYWLYRDGVWFRSHVHSGHWVRARTVPRAVLRIDRPRAYVRYRARTHRRSQPAARTHDHRRGVRRDRRDRRDDRPRVQRRDHR